MKKRNLMLTCIFMLLLICFLFFANGFDSYVKRILSLCAIYTILGVSMNLIIGFTGLFTLGHAGFMAIGAYVTALLTISVEGKQANFFLSPLIAPLDRIVWPFLPALLLGGVLAALAAFLIGAPALKLRGDYLAVATLGFSEIIRVVLTNLQNVTNGALGLKGIPPTANMNWCFGAAIITLLIIISFINSSYGRALKAIREDEIATEAMGINLFKHKVLSFCISAFFAGIGGGLLSSLMSTIDPTMFKLTLTFNILLIVVLGGMGSITGSILSAFIVTSSMELLRFLDEGIAGLPALPGLRMVVFSAILVLCVLFFKEGLMGTREFSWDKLISLFGKKSPAKGGAD